MDNTPKLPVNQGAAGPKRKRKQRSDKGKPRKRRVDPLPVEDDPYAADRASSEAFIADLLGETPKETAKEPPPPPTSRVLAALEESVAVADRIASINLQRDTLMVGRRLYAKFPDFLRPVWRNMIPGSPDPTALQFEIADYMAYGPSRRLILGFRGVAKSYICAAWIAWLYMHDEEERVKYLSGSEDKVGEFSGFTKAILRSDGMPFLRPLIPGTKSRDSTFSWDVGIASRQQSPSFSGNPVLSAMQGGRATTGVADDTEQKSNSVSDLMRERLITRVMDVSAMLLPDRQQHLLGLGTYQVIASIYDRLVKERGFDVFYVPARVPSKVSDYNGKLAPSIAARAKIKEEVGKPTETRFSEEKLRVYEKGAGPLQWQLEWMMSTKHGDRFEHPFPLDRFIVWDAMDPHGAPKRIVPGSSKDHVLPDLPCFGLPGDNWYRPAFVDQSEMRPYGTICMGIDPAGSGSVDEAAYVVVGAVHGQIHVLDFGGRPNGVDPKTLRMLAAVAKKWRVREIVYESNLQVWGSVFEQVLKEEYPCKTEGVRSNERKTLRIGALEPVLYAGQIVLSRKAIQEEYDRARQSDDSRWQERLLQHQVAMFRRSEKDGGIAYDDRLDALAMTIAYLHERYLKTSSETLLREEAERAAEERENEWQRSHFGDGRWSDREPTWAATRR